jgi:hypothetical protein
MDAGCGDVAGHLQQTFTGPALDVCDVRVRLLPNKQRGWAR